MAYWTAAVADFIVALLALIPSRMGVTQYVYPMGLMSAVAFSWGVILLFADRKPLERRWILVPTLLVVVLLGMVGLHAGITAVMPWTRIIPSSVVILIIISMLTYALIQSKDLKENRTVES
jgi:hypothetical protein